MADIFISYSRKDAAFVTTLRDALLAAKRDVWLDKNDIPPSAAWMHEIAAAIDTASAVIVVLSPDYVVSEVCTQELSRALESRKKLIPIVCRDVTPGTVTPDLRALNWIFSPGPAIQPQALQAILQAIDTDLEYVRAGAKWLVRARAWESSQRNASFALRGKELAEAEQWIASSGNKIPPPSALALSFINTSRVVERVRQRRTVSLLTTGIIITLVLAILSSALFVTTNRQNQQLTQKNHLLVAKYLAGRSNAALLNSQIDQSLLLGVAANKDPQYASFETRDALFSALEYSPYLEKVLQSRADARTLTDHLIAAQFSQDGNTLMTANLNGKISLWDMRTKSLRSSFNYYGVGLDAATLSPDGSTVVTSGVDGLYVWNVATKTIARQLLKTDTTSQLHLSQQQLAFSHDGRDVISADCTGATCASGQLTFWNVVTGQRDLALSLDSAPYQLVMALSQDGKTLAATYCDTDSCTHINTFALWDIASHTRLLNMRLTNLQSVLSIAFNPTGSLVALSGCSAGSACEYDTIQFWNARTSRWDGAAITRQNDAFTSLAFNPDGSRLLAGSDYGRLQQYDVAQRTAAGDPLHGHTGFIDAIAYRPNSSEFVSAGFDDLLLLWDNTPNTAYSLPLQLGLDGSSQAVFSPDGKYVATGFDGDVVIWSLATGTPTAQLERPQDGDLASYSLAYSPDGRYIASGSFSTGKIILWDTTTLAPSGAPLLGHTPGMSIERLAFSPDGRYLVSCGDDGKVILWDVGARQALHTFVNTLGGAVDQLLYSAAFSPDSSTLVMGASGNARASSDYTYPLMRWNIEANKALPSLYGHTTFVRAVTYSHDGKYIASLADNGEVMLWDATTGKPLTQPFNTPQDEVAFHGEITFSPDDRTLIASHDSVAVLWDVSDVRHPELLVHALISPTEVFNTAISPDGRLWLETGLDTPVTIHYLQPIDWQKEACGIANRNFTAAEMQQYGLDSGYAHECSLG